MQRKEVKCRVGDFEVEQVDGYTYLGILLNENSPMDWYA